MSPIKILIVDDEPDILEFLKYNLDKDGFNTLTASNGYEALEVAQKELPELIILDLMMPEMDGIEVCRLLREKPQFKHTTIIFLTARGESYSEIAGLNAGADDYITKPIKIQVFLTKIKALLRRSMGKVEVSDIIRFGEIVIDKGRHLIIKNGSEINLPKKEYEVFLLLASKPGRLFSRQEIYSSVWGSNLIVGDRTLDVHIRKLREKVGEDIIQTVKGVGYKINNV